MAEGTIEEHVENEGGREREREWVLVVTWPGLLRNETAWPNDAVGLKQGGV